MLPHDGDAPPQPHHPLGPPITRRTLGRMYRQSARMFNLGLLGLLVSAFQSVLLGGMYWDLYEKDQDPNHSFWSVAHVSLGCVAFFLTLYGCSSGTAVTEFLADEAGLNAPDSARG